MPRQSGACLICTSLLAGTAAQHQSLKEGYRRRLKTLLGSKTFPYKYSASHIEGLINKYRNPYFDTAFGDASSVYPLNGQRHARI
ncbi:MAG: hypothetical protein HY308_09350 [Gammaproteobacteria bacterium]|nr:hypothetical protein [Gammaproteobacteria bacterium]